MQISCTNMWLGIKLLQITTYLFILGNREYSKQEYKYTVKDWYLNKTTSIIYSWTWTKYNDLLHKTLSQLQEMDSGMYNIVQEIL